jgi:hypothetical protein
VKAAAANPAIGADTTTTAAPAAPAVPAAKPPAKGTTGASLTGLQAAKPPAKTLKVNVPKVKSGFGYRGGF